MNTTTATTTPTMPATPTMATMTMLDAGADPRFGEFTMGQVYDRVARTVTDMTNANMNTNPATVATPAAVPEPVAAPPPQSLLSSLLLALVSLAKSLASSLASSLGSMVLPAGALSDGAGNLTALATMGIVAIVIGAMFPMLAVSAASMSCAVLVATHAARAKP